MTDVPQELEPDDVAERRRWARRQGSPSWLWPDVAVEDWRRATLQIEDAVRAVLAGKPASILSVDPVALGLAGYTSGTGPLLGYWRRRGMIEAPPAINQVLDRHFDHNERRVDRMLSGATAVTTQLSNHGIRVVMLKGAHTALDYFPMPSTRPASDIDLLVRETDAALAAAILRSNGFVASSESKFESSWQKADAAPEPRSLYFVHADDPWSIDLHHSLDIFVGAGSPIARLDLGDPMASQRPWRGHDSARVFGQPLLLLHLAVHAGTGLQSLTMLRLIELVLVIRKDSANGTLSWNDFVALALRTGSLGYAFPALMLCENLAPGTVPAEVLNRCAAAAPRRVRAVVATLSPATAQRVDRSSVGEHFMWTTGATGWVRQLAADLAPGVSWNKFWSIYTARSWQIMRGRVGR